MLGYETIVNRQQVRYRKDLTTSRFPKFGAWLIKLHLSLVFKVSLMRLFPSLLGISIGVFLLSSPPAQAADLELQVFKASDTQDPRVRCPARVIVTETPQPYREGSYTIDGRANLSAIADGVTIAARDNFSVTWVAQLKPEYRQCKATARIVKSGNKPFSGHSYLRMRLMAGKAYLILDMTGVSDANSLTSVILKQSVQQGNPVWSWGGSD